MAVGQNVELVSMDRSRHRVTLCRSAYEEERTWPRKELRCENPRVRDSRLASLRDRGDRGGILKQGRARRHAARRHGDSGTTGGRGRRNQGSATAVAHVEAAGGSETTATRPWRPARLLGTHRVRIDRTRYQSALWPGIRLTAARATRPTAASTLLQAYRHFSRFAASPFGTWLIARDNAG